MLLFKIPILLSWLKSLNALSKLNYLSIYDTKMIFY